MSKIYAHYSFIYLYIHTYIHQSIPWITGDVMKESMATFIAGSSNRNYIGQEGVEVTVGMLLLWLEGTWGIERLWLEPGT